MAYTTATATADLDGIPSKHMSTTGSSADDDGMDSDSQMQYPDNRCTCCPYGYHIDLDFLRYCEGLSNGQYLRNLKKIERNKRKLRQSMEVFIQQQQRENDTQVSGPPPDVVNSTDNFMNMVECEDSATSNILEEIDTSVNATLSSIDALSYKKRRSGGYYQNRHHRYYPESDDDLTDGSSRYNGYQPDRYRTETSVTLQNQKQNYLSKSESLSSFSSNQSTQSSDFNMANIPPGSKVRETTTTKTIHHFVAAPPAPPPPQKPLQFSVHPGQLALEERPRSVTPQTVSDLNDNVDSSGVSEETLRSMREQMAVSLQRLRELEEQVKAIPVLQVRNSVLKEEKRLMALQLQAKNNKLNMRSVGVGDKFVDEIEMPPKPPTRSIGIGDGNVHDKQLNVYSPGSQPVSTREREIRSEENTHVLERQHEIRTMMTDLRGGKGYRPPPPVKPKPLMKTIGVGDNNVFDTTSNVHIHAKETKTLIVGGDQNKVKDARNVGINCKPTLRDVGVMHKKEDEKPITRSIGVGVGESYLIYSQEGELIEGFPTHTTIHNTKQTLSQLNMAAFHTRNINIRQEDIKYIVNHMLKKEVHSKAIQVTTATIDEAIQHEGYQMVNVSCGEDTVDVEVKPKVRLRSVATEMKPSLVHRSCITDKVYTRDEGCNTVKEKTLERATATVPVITYPAATNTVTVRTHSANTETDMKIFQALDQVKNQGCNTNKVVTYERGMCTEDQQKILGKHGFDLDIRFQDKGVNTSAAKYTTNKAVNTIAPRSINIGVGNTDIRKGFSCDTCLSKDSSQRDVITKEYTTSLSRSKERSDDRLSKSSDKINRSSDKVDKFSDKINRSSDRLNRSTDKLNRSNEKLRSRSSSGELNKPNESTTQSSTGLSSPRRQYANRSQYEASKLLSDNDSHTIVTKTATTRYGTDHSSSTPDVNRGESSAVSSQRHSINRVNNTSSNARGSSSTSNTSLANHSSYPQSDKNTSHSTHETSEMFGKTYGTSGGPKVKITREVHSTVRKGQSAPVENHSKSIEYTDMSRFSSMDENMRQMLEGKTPKHQLDMAAMLGQEEEYFSLHKQLHNQQSNSSRSSESTDYQELEGLESDINTPSSSISFKKGAGGTQMRVIQHTETSYVGGKQVNKASNLELGEDQRHSSTSLKTSPTAREYKPPSSAFDKGRFGVSSPPPDIEQVVVGKNMSSPEDLLVTKDTGLMSVPGKLLSVTETRIESQRGKVGERITSSNSSNYNRTYTQSGGKLEREESPGTTEEVLDQRIQVGNNSLKSIMKQPGEESPKVKRGISFAESVQGGYLSDSETDTSVTSGSDGEEDMRQEEQEGYLDGSGDESDASSQSYDEGSYDGRKGEIVYKGKDNEREQELYDQGIRETYEISEDLRLSCDTFALWLDDSTQVTSKELTASKSLIQQEWFKISSHKLSDRAQVEDYLSAFKEISPALLQNVVNMTDANTNTGLHYAVSHCNIDVVNLLLDSGVCDVNKQNKAGYTACMLASLAQIQSQDQLQVIKKLFASGDVNARASQASQTALMLAVSHGRLENVRLLLEAGADINMKDEDGSTALMCASEHGHTDIVKLLLSQPECDASLQDNDGSTALMIAMEAGHRDIGVQLYAHLNFNAGTSPDRFRMSALQ